LKSHILPTEFRLIVDSSEMEFVPKTFAVSVASSEALLASASSFTINAPELLPLSEPSTPGSCMRIIDLSHITSSFTRGCAIQLTFSETHSSSSSAPVSVKIFGIILIETDDILVRVASSAIAKSSLASSSPPPSTSSNLPTSPSCEALIRQLQTGLKWLQLLNEPADAVAKIGKPNPTSSENINRCGRAMNGSDGDEELRFCGRSFADGSACSSNTTQCPDCMAGPIIIQNPSKGSASSLFASKTLSPALEIAIMNLFVVNEPSKGFKILHVPLELECTTLLSDLLFSHMLSPQYAPAFRSTLAASVSGLHLHPAIIHAVKEIIICHSLQSSYADSPESSSPTGFIAAFVEAVDEVTYEFACRRLGATSSTKHAVEIDVVIQCVQEACSTVFGSFQQVSGDLTGISTSSTAGPSTHTHTKLAADPVFSEDLYQILEGMGFPRAACHLALKHADGDPERASEWIISNIDDLDSLIHADEMTKCDATPDPAPVELSSAPSPKSLHPAIAAMSTSCASRLLARLSAELMIFARALPWGSPVCDQFFTILGQGISSDSAQAAFIAGLKLGDGVTTDGGDAGKVSEGTGVIYRIVPSLVPSFMDAVHQIKSHPIYGSFKNDPLAPSASKTPLPKPKAKPPKPSDLERSMTEMGFPASKVQLAMKRNPGLTDMADQRHLNGLMEAILSLDDDDVELRALEEEQMAAAMSSSSAAPGAQGTADDAANCSLTSASDPVMMKFFGLSAALRYSLNSQGVWAKAGRGDMSMAQAVVASLAAANSAPSSSSILTSLLKYRQLITSTCNSITPSTQSKTFESDHPYDHNLNIDFSVSFPGARSIDIVFDPKCRTESSCDYLRFWQGSQQVGQDKYHGGSSGWPSLKLQGDSFRVTFFSDGSQNDWGYKFTATATCPPVAHWSDFEKTAAVLLPLIDASVAQLFTRNSAFHVPSDLLPLLEGAGDLVLPSCKVSSSERAVASSKDGAEDGESHASSLIQGFGSDGEGSGSEEDEADEIAGDSDGHSEDSHHDDEPDEAEIILAEILDSEARTQTDGVPCAVIESSKSVSDSVASEEVDSKLLDTFAQVAEVRFFFITVYTLFSPGHPPSRYFYRSSAIPPPQPPAPAPISSPASPILVSTVSKSHFLFKLLSHLSLPPSYHAFKISPFMLHRRMPFQLTRFRNTAAPPVSVHNQQFRCLILCICFCPTQNSLRRGRLHQPLVVARSHHSTGSSCLFPCQRFLVVSAVIIVIHQPFNYRST
jgi:hypothetical protein